MAIPTKINRFQFCGKQNKISIDFFIGILVVVITYVHCEEKIKTVYSWTKIDYNWQNWEQAKNYYKAKNVVPHDIDVDKDSRVFVSFRGRYGVPATLGIVDTQHNSEAELVIKPYPDWKMFNVDDCNSIKDVLKTWIDKCNRLWVLDSGDSANTNVSCAPKLLLFDLSENKLIDRRQLDTSLKELLYYSFVVRTQGSTCQDLTVAYVFDKTVAEFYRVVNYTFYEVKNVSSVAFRQRNDYFYETEEIGAALSPDTDTLAFRYINELDMVNINQMKTLPENFVIQLITDSISKLKTSAFVFGKKNKLFFGRIDNKGIGCLDVEISRGKFSLPGTDKLSQIISLKIVDSNSEELWILSTNVTKSYHLTNESTQFQISKSSLFELTNGTKCQI